MPLGKAKILAFRSIVTALVTFKASCLRSAPGKVTGTVTYGLAHYGLSFQTFQKWEGAARGFYYVCSWFYYKSRRSTGLS